MGRDTTRGADENNNGHTLVTLIGTVSTDYELANIASVARAKPVTLKHVQRACRLKPPLGAEEGSHGRQPVERASFLSRPNPRKGVTLSLRSFVPAGPFRLAPTGLLLFIGDPTPRASALRYR